MQVEIGASQARDETIAEVVDRFAKSFAEAQERLERCFGPCVRVEQRLVFATTAGLSSAQRERLAARDVLLWDKAMLAERVWPSPLKQLPSQVPLKMVISSCCSGLIVSVRMLFLVDGRGHIT